MKLLTLIGTGVHAECRERSHGGCPLSHDLEQAGEVFRDFRIDRKRRPLVLPEIEVTAGKAFEGGWFGFR
jgi:hypothetical protein